MPPGRSAQGQGQLGNVSPEMVRPPPQGWPQPRPGHKGQGGGGPSVGPGQGPGRAAGRKERACFYEAPARQLASFYLTGRLIDLFMVLHLLLKASGNLLLKHLDVCCWKKSSGQMQMRLPPLLSLLLPNLGVGSAQPHPRSPPRQPVLSHDAQTGPPPPREQPCLDTQTPLRGLLPA